MRLLRLLDSEKHVDFGPAENWWCVFNGPKEECMGYVGAACDGIYICMFDDVYNQIIYTDLDRTNYYRIESEFANTRQENKPPLYRIINQADIVDALDSQITREEWIRIISHKSEMRTYMA